MSWKMGTFACLFSSAWSGSIALGQTQIPGSRVGVSVSFMIKLDTPAEKQFISITPKEGVMKYPILWQFLNVLKLLFADSLENGFICEISRLLALPSAWLLLILACLSLLLLPYSHSMPRGPRTAHLERRYITLSEIKAKVISMVIISNSFSLCCQYKCFFHKVSWVIQRTNQHCIS